MRCIHSIRASYNTPLSAVCGQYCIFYVWQRGLLSSPAATMNSVLSIFTPNDQYYNDSLVNTLVEEHLIAQEEVYSAHCQETFEHMAQETTVMKNKTDGKNK